MAHAGEVRHRRKVTALVDPEHDGSGVVPRRPASAVGDRHKRWVQGTQLIYLEDMSHGQDDEDSFLDRHMGDSDADPINVLRDQRLRTALVAAIKNLPEREQYIMSMYYEQDMNLKEIAAVLDVTESRICQLHSQSIARLRAKMRTH